MPSRRGPDSLQGSVVTAVDSISGAINRSYDVLDRLVCELEPQGVVD